MLEIDKSYITYRTKYEKKKKDSKNSNGLRVLNHIDNPQVKDMKQMQKTTGVPCHWLLPV